MIDGKSGKCLDDLFGLQLRTQDADQNGGLGHKNASAAGMYGCLAIKCSADDCICDGKGKGYLKVPFPVRRMQSRSQFHHNVHPHHSFLVDRH